MDSAPRPESTPWNGRHHLSGSAGLGKTQQQERKVGPVRWGDTNGPAESPNGEVQRSSGSFTGSAAAQTTPNGKSSREHEALLEEAAKSGKDHAGRYRCLGCGRVCGDLASLCQHLKDRHRGLNSAIAPGSVSAGGAVNSRPQAKLSLADFLSTGTAQRGARVTPARDLQLTERQIRNVRGFVKAYPNKQDLAKAIKGRLKSSSGKKKLSRLKRLIVREKTDNAAEAAAQNSEAAAAAASKAKAAHASVSQSLQDAKLKLTSDGGGDARLPPKLVTEVQVLEMALAEAERRVTQTSKKAVEAEEAVVKARADQDKAWKRTLPDAEAKARAEGNGVHDMGQEGQAGVEPAPRSEAPQHSDPGSHTSAGKAETSSSVAGALPPASVKARGATEATILEEEPLEEEESDDDDEDGLQGFEDVLATWLHDANQKTLALGGVLDSPTSTRHDGQSADQAQEEGSEAGSLTDSDGLGPDGWDDVLSAWMSNAGILNQKQQQQEQPPPEKDDSQHRGGNGKPAPGPAVQIPAPSAALPPARASTPAQHPPRRALDVGTPVRQSTAFDYLTSPKPPSAANLSPRSTIPPSPEAASYGSLLLGAGSEASFNLSQDASLGSRGWLGGAGALSGRGSTPGSLLTGGLGSGQFSVEDIMGLQASMAENSFHSDEEGLQRDLGAAASLGSNGRLQGMPSRHSDLGTAALSMSGGGIGSRNARQQNSWGPWSGSTNINAGRWSDSGATLPRLQSADPATFRRNQDAVFEEARAGLQGQGLSLLERTASVGAVQDLNLPRRHTTTGNLQGAKLFGNSFSSMGQGQSHLESSPLPPRLSGLEHAFSSLASMSGAALTETTQHGGHSAGWLPTNDLRQPEAVHGQSSQQHGYLNGQQGSPHPESMQQRLSSQLQPILSSQWEQHGHALQEPSPFQGNPNGGSMLFQDAQGLGDQHFLPQEQPAFPFDTNLSHQHLLLEQARLSQSMGLGMQNGLFPDSFHMGGHPQANLPHYHSYPGPQSTLQGMPNMNSGVDSMFALRSLLSEGGAPPSMYGDALGQRVSGLPEWNGGHRGHGTMDPPPAVTHDFHCATCNVSCCGLMNYQQHCNSKRHLRKTAAAGAAVVSEAGSPNTGDEGETSPTLNPTYVGLQAQCRNYCKQVITTDLNRVVVDLLQQLLFWQDRSKAMNVHNAAKKKRLVSGLREVAKAIRLGKAKTIVVTPNIEKIEAEGGLDDLLTSILEQAQQTNCPIVFALSRKKLGQIFGCRKKMSAIAILDYAGAEDLYREMEQLAQEGRSQWEAYRSEGKTPPPADDLEASAEDSLAQGQSLANGSPVCAPDAENDTANSLPSPADSGRKSLSQGLTS